MTDLLTEDQRFVLRAYLDYHGIEGEKQHIMAAMLEVLFEGWIR